jgi:hypothetical protein
MVAIQVNLARGNQEVAMNQVDDSIGKVGREVRAVIDTAILAQATRYVDPWIALG